LVAYANSIGANSIILNILYTLQLEGQVRVWQDGPSMPIGQMQVPVKGLQSPTSEQLFGQLS